jgi:hypothetical protein
MWKYLLPTAVLSIFQITFADSATQTDWSGRSGVFGPVIELGNEFYRDTDVKWQVSDSTLTASFIPVPFLIQNDLNIDRLYCSHLNQDSYDDIVSAGYQLKVYLNSETNPGYEWNEYLVYPYRTRWITTADLDGDGDTDIAGGPSLTGGLFWWENSGSGTGQDWIMHEIYAYPDCDDIGVADIDEDGDIDLFACHTNAGLVWIENVNGSGTSWNIELIPNLHGLPSCISIEDFNGDGCVDVAASYDSEGCILWFENDSANPGHSWTEHFVDNLEDAELVTACDINGDGYADIVGYKSPNMITSWQNQNGQGTSWSEYIISIEYLLGNQLSNHDIDGDGDMDVLCGTQESGSAWWENENGNGHNWIKHQIVDEDFSKAICAGDFDSDGRSDIATSGYWPSFWLTWWNIDYTSGSLESSILDTGTNPIWGTINWTAASPSGTSIGSQVRSMDSPYGVLPLWSDTLWVPCSLEGILTNGHRYVQYRAILVTSDPDTTSTLFDITITWNPVGIGHIEETDLLNVEFSPIVPNPSSGSSLIKFGLPECSNVGFSIFDLSGRLIRTIQRREYLPGYHDVLIRDLLPGTYFCRMTSGDYTAVQRFVVIQ